MNSYDHIGTLDVERDIKQKKKNVKQTKSIFAIKRSVAYV